MKRAHFLTLALALLTYADIGCGGAARHPRDTVLRPVIGNGLPVEVRNRTPTDMSVYVVVDGAWTCIGFVAGLRSATFEIGALERSGAPLLIRATPLHGGGEARSKPLTVFPGQVVTFTIEPDLASSSATVR